MVLVVELPVQAEQVVEAMAEVELLLDQTEQPILAAAEEAAQVLLAARAALAALALSSSSILLHKQEY